MKFKLILSCILLILNYCVTKQAKKINGINTSNMLPRTNQDDNSVKESGDSESTFQTKDQFNFGILHFRIDSIKNLANNNGGHSDTDSSIALFLRLSDSVRRIGPYELKYNGQQFGLQKFNKKKPNRLDLEITEEHRGIVSIQKRMMNKPDYLPLVNQQIEFYDENNRLVNSFDINKNNPFLTDKSKKVKEYVYPPPNNRSELITDSDSNWKQQVKNYYSYNRFHVQENGYIIVEYQLYGMDAHEGILKSISTLMILDSTSKEVGRFNELENMLHYYWMASSGKYLMINGGGILGEGFQRLENSFLRIYEARSKKMIYEEALNIPTYEYGEFYESESPEKIMVSYKSFQKSDDQLFTELIFDLDNKKRCIKVFSQMDWNKITNEGIKYSGNEWLHEFKFDCKTF